MSECVPDSGALYTALSDDVRRSFRRRGFDPDLAEDLTQDVFLRVHRSRSSVQSGERVDAWVRRIAHNVLVDATRRGRLRPVSTDALDPAAKAAEPDTEGEVASWLPAAIGQLPAPYAEVLRLADLDGQPHRAIGERLGLSVPAVKSRVSRGRAMLRAAVLACCALEFDRRGRVVGYERRRRDDCSCD